MISEKMRIKNFFELKEIIITKDDKEKNEREKENKSQIAIKNDKNKIQLN